MQILHNTADMHTDQAPTATARAVAHAVNRARIRQDALARVLDLPRSSVSRRLTGRVQWRVDELQTVARLLGTTVDELIGGETNA